MKERKYFRACRGEKKSETWNIAVKQGTRNMLYAQTFSSSFYCYKSAKALKVLKMRRSYFLAYMAMCTRCFEKETAEKHTFCWLERREQWYSYVKIMFMHFDFNFTNGTDYILYILNFIKNFFKEEILYLFFFFNYFHLYHLYKIK